MLPNWSKKIIPIGGMISCILLIVFWMLGERSEQVENYQFKNSRTLQPTHVLTIAKQSPIQVQIAHQIQDKIQSLLFYDSLQENQGILIPLEHNLSLYFGTNEMRFSIDVLAFDKDSILIKKYTNIPPFKKEMTKLHDSTTFIVQKLGNTTQHIKIETKCSLKKL